MHLFLFLNQQIQGPWKIIAKTFSSKVLFDQQYLNNFIHHQNNYKIGNQEAIFI